MANKENELLLEKKLNRRKKRRGENKLLWRVRKNHIPGKGLSMIDCLIHFIQI